MKMWTDGMTTINRWQSEKVKEIKGNKRKREYRTKVKEKWIIKDCSNISGNK